jgi:polysaccharide biosynthesis transport protein
MTKSIEPLSQAAAHAATTHRAELEGRGAPEFSELIKILALRKIWIIGTTALFVGLALAYVMLTAPLYGASVQIIVDPRDRQVIDRSIQSGQTNAENGLAIVESQINIIEGEGVLRRVVDTLKLDEDTEFGGRKAGFVRTALEGLGLGGMLGEAFDPVTRAVQKLQTRVATKRADRAFVIDVGVLTEDPDKSVKIANAIADAYLLDQAQSRSAFARETSEALGSRLDELREKVRVAEDKVEAFKRQNNFIGASGRLVSEQQLTEVNNQLSAARARTAEAQARLDQVQRARGGVDAGAAIPEALRSQTIALLRGQLSEVLRAQSESSNLLGPRHPTTIATQAQAEGVRRQIQDEVNRIADSARSDFERALANERSLERSLDALKRDAVSLGAASVQLRELEREAEASRAVYNAFLVRARETSEQQGLDTTNARVISRALKPRDASWPPRAIILVAALLGGLGLGSGLALLREAGSETIRSTRQIRHLTGHSAIEINSGEIDSDRKGLFGRKSQPTARTVEEQLFELSADPSSDFARGVRGALNTVLESSPTAGERIILITSAHAGSGNSTLAVNMGLAGLQDGGHVLVIDANPLGPSIAENLRLSPDASLADVLSGEVPLEDAVLDNPDSQLHLLPGEPTAKPWIRSPRLVGEWRALLKEAADYDLIVIDAGPIIGTPMALMVAPLVHDIVLVARPGETAHTAFVEAVAALGIHAEKVRVTVLFGEADGGAAPSVRSVAKRPSRKAA